jgi:O-antigen/teichoic acid export membrane protein
VKQGITKSCFLRKIPGNNWNHYMIKRLFNTYKDNIRFRQVLSLFSVNVLVIPISFISNIIITNYLGPVSFGDFKFIINVFNFSCVLFNFGFFHAANRALVLNSDPGKAREYYGAMLIVTATIYFLMSLILVFYAFFDHNIQEKGLRLSLLWVIPFAWTFMLNSYFEIMLQADNKINLLAQSRIVPRITFFLSVVGLYFFLRNSQVNKLGLIWTCFLSTQIFGYLYILYRIGPSFRNLKTRVIEIWRYNKAYGFNVYSGALFDTGFEHLGGLLIGYFGFDNAGVGFYALALTIAEPLSFIPNVIATTHFREFAQRESISKNLLLTTIGIAVIGLVATWVLVGPFIMFFYSPKFYPVITLTYIVSIGVLFNGFGDFFNRFLCSHGQGKALRNSAIIVGVLLVVMNITLIPAFLEKGAAYTRICSGFAYFAIMFLFYRKLTSRLKKEGIGNVTL